jgi:hypothetical protein
VINKTLLASMIAIMALSFISGAGVARSGTLDGLYRALHLTFPALPALP